MYPRFTPASVSELSIQILGNFTPLSRVGTLYAFQPRIRAVGLAPTSDSQLSIGEFNLITDSYLSPFLQRFQINESHSKPPEYSQTALTAL